MNMPIDVQSNYEWLIVIAAPPGQWLLVVDTEHELVYLDAVIALAVPHPEMQFNHHCNLIRDDYPCTHARGAISDAWHNCESGVVCYCYDLDQVRVYLELYLKDTDRFNSYVVSRLREIADEVARKTSLQCRRAKRRSQS